MIWNLALGNPFRTPLSAEVMIETAVLLHDESEVLDLFKIRRRSGVNARHPQTKSRLAG
jgi:hypothetical protein